MFTLDVSTSSIGLQVLNILRSQMWPRFVGVSKLLVIDACSFNFALLLLESGFLSSGRFRSFAYVGLFSGLCIFFNLGDVDFSDRSSLTLSAASSVKRFSSFACSRACCCGRSAILKRNDYYMHRWGAVDGMD
jgi:hypothetical protein